MASTSTVQREMASPAAYGPAFGLVAVDRKSFRRTAKPSLAWLGAIARGNRLG
jgi:beta-glucosidase